MVNMYDEWNYPAAYFYRNDIQKGANYSYSPDYTQLGGFSQAAGGLSNMGTDWGNTASVTASAPGHDIETGHADGGTVAGLGAPTPNRGPMLR